MPDIAEVIMKYLPNNTSVTFVCYRKLRWIHAKFQLQPSVKLQLLMQILPLSDPKNCHFKTYSKQSNKHSRLLIQSELWFHDILCALRLTLSLVYRRMRASGFDLFYQLRDHCWCCQCRCPFRSWSHRGKEAHHQAELINRQSGSIDMIRIEEKNILGNVCGLTSSKSRFNDSRRESLEPLSVPDSKELSEGALRLFMAPNGWLLDLFFAASLNFWLR